MGKVLGSQLNVRIYKALIDTGFDYQDAVNSAHEDWEGDVQSAVEDGRMGPPVGGVQLALLPAPAIMDSLFELADHCESCTVQARSHPTATIDVPLKCCLLAARCAIHRDGRHRSL